MLKHIQYSIEIINSKYEFIQLGKENSSKLREAYVVLETVFSRLFFNLTKQLAANKNHQKNEIHEF